MKLITLNTWGGRVNQPLLQFIKNNDSIDIHASKLEDNNNMFAIQVKSTQHNIRKWMLNKKVENVHSKNMFYVFVCLKGLEERPDYFIVPSKTLATLVKKSHQKWLDTPGKKGQ